MRVCGGVRGDGVKVCVGMQAVVFHSPHSFLFFPLSSCTLDPHPRPHSPLYFPLHSCPPLSLLPLSSPLPQCDANPDITKVAIQEDKYENILTLITYYQMVRVDQPSTSDGTYCWMCD